MPKSVILMKSSHYLSKHVTLLLTSEGQALMPSDSFWIFWSCV